MDKIRKLKTPVVYGSSNIDLMLRKAAKAIVKRRNSIV